MGAALGLTDNPGSSPFNSAASVAVIDRLN